MPLPEAGRDLDAMVAEKIMDYKWYIPRYGNIRCLFDDATARRYPVEETPIASIEAIPLASDWSRELALFSTSIGSAWSVIENMQQRGYWVKITGPWEPTDPPSPVKDIRAGMGDGCHGYSVGFEPHGTVSCGSSWVLAENASVCVAICHAALICLDLWANAERLDPDGNIMAPDGWQTAGRRKVEFNDYFLTEDGRVGLQDGYVVFKDDGIRVILQRLDPDVASS